MKISPYFFSAVVRCKAKPLLESLKSKNVKIIPWKNMSDADGVLVWNIHSSAYPAIRTASNRKIPIISLQEGLYALGWKATVPAMRKECVRANTMNIHQVVWSRFERENYITTGRKPDMIVNMGNPEHDLLFNPLRETRSTFGIPEHAFVVVYLAQYAHPRGGPNEQELKQMAQYVMDLISVHSRVWVIHCLHPKQSRKVKMTQEGRRIIRPFRFPVFDIIRMSDLVVTLSSTEAITASILKKPIIEYDISNSNPRWPFSQHGVSIRANNQKDLKKYVNAALEKKLQLPRNIDYAKEYQADGNSSNRVADYIIQHFSKV